MIGTMRLVNPDRGSALVVVMGRLTAVSEDGGTHWEVVLIHGSRQFYTRRPLSCDEFGAIAAGDAEDGPWCWRWIGMSESGAVRLGPRERPTQAELFALGQKVCQFDPIADNALPRMDRFEVWLCNRETGRPVALAATALSREMALAIPHVRPWQCVEPPLQTAETWAFQSRINNLLNRYPRSGRYRFVVRLYERDGDRVVRHGLDGPIGQVRSGFVPDGLLAEPWESERLALLAQLARRRPSDPRPARNDPLRPGTARTDDLLPVPTEVLGVRG